MTSDKFLPFPFAYDYIAIKYVVIYEYIVGCPVRDFRLKKVRIMSKKREFVTGPRTQYHPRSFFLSPIEGEIRLNSREIRIDLSRSVRRGEIVSDIKEKKERDGPGGKREGIYPRRKRIYFFHFRGSANIQKY